LSGFGFNEEKAVGQLAAILALECGATAAEAKRIQTAAILHDVGKQRIDPAILNKPGKLTAAEFEIVKTHTTIGFEMLRSIQGELGEWARQIALLHHERWDKTGYWGKTPAEVPFYIQYVSLADVFTALVSVRSYKAAWPPEDALEYIRSQSGEQFNPLLVDVFVPLARTDERVKSIFGEVKNIAGGA
jgi:HD-GYP domain-containing protein (c-di-GMP phosphodiesterase class II)